MGDWTQDPRINRSESYRGAARQRLWHLSYQVYGANLTVAYRASQSLPGDTLGTRLGRLEFPPGLFADVLLRVSCSNIALIPAIYMASLRGGFVSIGYRKGGSDGNRSTGTRPSSYHELAPVNGSTAVKSGCPIHDRNVD